jgi:hypothetical protein
MDAIFLPVTPPVSVCFCDAFFVLFSFAGEFLIAIRKPTERPVGYLGYYGEFNEFALSSNTYCHDSLAPSCAKSKDSKTRLRLPRAKAACRPLSTELFSRHD